MCGGSYSSDYASKGELQLRHYMGQLGVNIGYLVVFDGRLREFGRSVLPSPDGFSATAQTVRELFVDVRPRWDEGPIAGE